VCYLPAGIVKSAKDDCVPVASLAIFLKYDGLACLGWRFELEKQTSERIPGALPCCKKDKDAY